MNLLVSCPDAVEQPPLRDERFNNELTVAIASLSIGGAERIVLDWASRISPRWNVHLIVLRNREKEWSVPPHIKITRLEDERCLEARGLQGSAHQCRLIQLRILGAQLATSVNPICVCHLLNQEERDALSEQGVVVITVLHNAKEGWPEDASRLTGSIKTIAVSDACARELGENGWAGSVSVIRHIPSKPGFLPNARKEFRKAWNIPENSTVIGMIGSVKPQKNYVKALHIIKAFHEKMDAYLVILGGPLAGSAARTYWEEVVSEIHRLGLRARVAMPGFIPNAALCLPAFDALLNTSRFEGLSIATLEALVSLIPVVASKVGGQGEIGCEGLTLIPENAPQKDWVWALYDSLHMKMKAPSWSSFPSHRLWTLVALARPIEPSGKVLFVTANLNAGGAQRSLVNLANVLQKTLPFSITVAGNSTEDYFYRDLRSSGVEVVRATASSNPFDNAESVVHTVCNDRIGTVCFWNLDSKVKLLVVKALDFTNARFIDVSPGGYGFEEMAEAETFQHLIAFSQDDYYRRLDALVLKYYGVTPSECEGKTFFIPNGIPEPEQYKTNYATGPIPRIAVSGRIAPTKFILEAIEAMRLVWEQIPAAQLHLFGGAEQEHRAYADSVFDAAKDELGARIFFYGVDFEAASRMHEFDAYVVLGKNQGCPNALLEALASGLPAVANNDGGTSEQLIHNRTGLLIQDRSPEELADALINILRDRNLARRLGTAGRKHVMKKFSMEKMSCRYAELLGGDGSRMYRPSVIHRIAKRNLLHCIKSLFIR